MCARLQVMGNLLPERRLATATCLEQCALLRVDGLLFRQTLEDPKAKSAVAKKVRAAEPLFCFVGSPPRCSRKHLSPGSFRGGGKKSKGVFADNVCVCVLDGWKVAYICRPAGSRLRQAVSCSYGAQLEHSL